jgi:glycosyltransferase involved in cell wall biosynthesis
MELAILFDHRFYRDNNGVLFSLKPYNYRLFAERYLPVFDRVHILARVSETTLAKGQYESAVSAGVEIISLGDWAGPFDFLRQRRSSLSKLYGYLSKKELAIVMLVPGTIASMAYDLLKKNDRPYAVEVVSDPYDAFAPGSVRHLFRPFFRWWFCHQMRHHCADAFAATYVTRQALQERYPCPSYSVGISAGHIGTEDLVPAPPVFRRPAHFTVLFVGSLAQLYKAPDVLIKAFALCVREGLDIKLVIIGDGKHRTELESLADGNGLSDRVTFLGQVPPGETLRAKLDEADLFVLPSHQEGLPRALIEAMARSLPCIGSNVGGIPELLAPEDMIPPGDAMLLARKIKEVLQDPLRMALMSERNLAKAREYHEDSLRNRRQAFYEHLREGTEAWLKGH